MRVLGVDPGRVNTGMVVRQGEDLLAWRLLHREGTEDAREPMTSWIERTLEVTRGLGLVHRADMLAVEGYNSPTAHLGVVNTREIIDTCQVIGALIGWQRTDPDFAPAGLVVVPPAGHGKAAEGLGRRGLLACYPEGLVGARERKGMGKRKDVRAAWDCAGAMQVRQLRM